jgi:pimeloyl-ACP methyl ester carboxylesterase
MFETLKKLTYGARVLLSRKGGPPQALDLHGRRVMVMQGGEGPAFVYLHSSLGEALRWLPFLDRWASDFTVLVPTHPGFGESEGFDQIDTIEDLAFHYVELFDALGLEQVILGGVSLGGWIAAEFAVRWPERVEKLWLSGSPGLWVEDQPLPDLFRVMAEPARLRELLFHDPEGAVARMILADHPDDQRRLYGYQCMTALARLVWDRPYDPKLAARLRRVRCPVLLLWGEHDRLVPPAYGEAYRQHLPQAEWKVLPGCGHLAMFEKETEFVAAVAQFARGTSS